MALLDYIVGRFLQMIPVIIGVSLIAFVSIHFVPGDPVEIMTFDLLAVLLKIGFSLPDVRRFKSLDFIRGERDGERRGGVRQMDGL